MRLGLCRCIRSGAQEQVSLDRLDAIHRVNVEGDVFVEPIDVEVDTEVDRKKKARNILAALFGGGKTSGNEELHKVGQCMDDLVADFDVW